MRSTLISAVLLSAATAAAGCSPNPPTDGHFGCASAGNRCPAAFPYCDPVDDRCYASAPVDSGPRPDTGPAPDTGTVTGREFLACGSPANCGTLSCIGGACMRPCSTSSPCTDGRTCVPVSMMDSTTACVPACSAATSDCSMYPNTRARIVMGGICQCAPFPWP